MRSIRSAVTVGLLLVTRSLSAQTADSVQKCVKPLATMAVVEPQNVTVQSLSRYGLGSPTSLIRMMIQKSNCFTVVERGAGLVNMQQERQLARSGDLQQGSNVGGGQMVSADLLLTPNVIFEGNTGGAGGALGSVFRGPVGAVLGGLKFKQAQTSMLVGDMRTGVQVASAEGQARKTDFSLAALGFGGGMLTAMGGYTNTPEGKVIAASFLDNYNKIVIAVRDDSTFTSRIAAAAAPAGPVLAEGDVVRPKIDNVKLLAKPSDGSAEVATLKRTDELVYLGGEKEGFLHVQGAAGSGWVKKLLITK
jgi:curli biogenesis system outer membrane secretion channel CsgG